MFYVNMPYYWYSTFFGTRSGFLVGKQVGNHVADH